MRVTRIPGDFNDIGDRPCRVWCNEVEIQGWTVADDFRRVVETPGKVFHGAVRIELGTRYVRLPDEDNAEFSGWHDSTTGCLWMSPHGEDPNGQKPAPVPAETQPTGFHGIFVHVPDAPVVAEAAAAERAPTFAAPVAKAAPKHIPARKRKAGK